MKEKAKNLGRQFAPSICFGFGQEDSGLWYGSVDIGDYYYETDRYKNKADAVAEMVGCLEALKEKMEEVINELNDIIYGRKNFKRDLRHSQGGTDAE